MSRATSLRATSWKDKTVLVTGASAGIGAALARELGARGANLVLAARRRERLLALAAELGARASVVVVEVDVTRDGSVEAAVAEAERAFGGLDVVVANAGFAVTGRFERLSLDDYRRQLETNVFGVLRTIQAALPAIKRARGRVAIMGSVVGHIPTPGVSPYAMSKFAVRALAEALHDELRDDGVTVTLLSPGFVVSDIGRVDNHGERHDRDGARAPAWLRMPTDEAARQIVAAIEARRREAVITAHGRFGVFVYRHAPWLVRAALRLSRRRAAGRRAGGPEGRVD
ncbi:MAG TPA: SDR family NAD(P)-dependent oxidoreductase [Polyangia bacterium]|nr:SDR family NAD(P)-dependent oxidoreductase [Polyangia bacterium]